jgi:hypothetical protein
MWTVEDAEKALHTTLLAEREICNLGGQIRLGATFGSLVILGERPIGLWSALDDRFVFRDLSSYEPALEVRSIQEALDVTVALLTLCQQGWAERFGTKIRSSAAA